MSFCFLFENYRCQSRSPREFESSENQNGVHNSPSTHSSRGGVVSLWPVVYGHLYTDGLQPRQLLPQSSTVYGILCIIHCTTSIRGHSDHSVSEPDPIILWIYQFNLSLLLSLSLGRHYYRNRTEHNPMHDCTTRSIPHGRKREL